MVSSQIARLRCRLAGAMIGLARAADGNEHLITDATTKLILEALFATLPHAGYDAPALQTLIWRAEAAKQQMVPNCLTCAMPCGRTSDYDMAKLWESEGEDRDLKYAILFGLCGMASYAHAAAELGYREEALERFFYKALFVIGVDNWRKEQLLPVLMEMGEANRSYMVLLDKARLESNKNG